MLIRINNRVGEYQEWCILEFQGEMVGELPGKQLGTLEIMPGDKAEMEIGQHFLEGSVISLKSPYLIVIDDENANMAAHDTPADKELAIKGIVKKKVIFKTRPKPIGFKRPREA